MMEDEEMHISCLHRRMIAISIIHAPRHHPAMQLIRQINVLINVTCQWWWRRLVFWGCRINLCITLPKHYHGAINSQMNILRGGRRRATISRLSGLVDQKQEKKKKTSPMAMMMTGQKRRKINYFRCAWKGLPAPFMGTQHVFACHSFASWFFSLHSTRPLQSSCSRKSTFY